MAGEIEARRRRARVLYYIVFLPALLVLLVSGFIAGAVHECRRLRRLTK